MPKVLTVKDNTNLSANNIDDVIIVYPDNVNLYSKTDFLALPEFASVPEADRVALARKVCKKEQALILDDVFELTTMPGTLDEVQSQSKAVIPQRKEVWLDPVSGEWKDYVNPIKMPVKLEFGEFKHTLDSDPANTITVNESIRVAAAK